MSNKIKENKEQIPVLIAGGGLTGLSAALFLLQQGIHPVLIERRSGTSIHPRARGFDVRTMELFRELQLDQAIRDAGQSLSAAWGIYAGADLPAIVDQVPTDRAKIKHPIEIPGLEKIAALSPVSGARCTQDLSEPILLQAAIDRGADIHFDTELVSFTQDADGITAHIRDRNTNESSIVHCQYLIAADGGNSPIRRHLNAETTGKGALGNLLNIYFEAPLGDYVKGREFSIGLINRPGIKAMFTAINNNEKWVLHLHYDPQTERPEDFTTPRLESILHDIIQLPQVPVHIISMLPWQPTVKVVNNMQYGRLFLAGDAAHQMTPYGGKGAASGVQDVHNLAWKLALVLKQQAHPTLLDTYSPERQPIGLKNALISGEMADEKGILKADALTRFRDTSDKEKAFSWLLSMLGIPDYRYTSNAIAGAPNIADTGLVKSGGHPGTRVPHHWLQENDIRRSTLDLAVTHFTLVTDEAGTHWHSAVTAIADNFRMPISVKVITDTEWKTAANLATGDALLIRPDGFVAWHSADGTYTLEQALAKILGVTISEEQKA